MSTPPDPLDDDWAELPDDDTDSEALPTADGAYSDEAVDPAMAPVIEAGGGVSEGFEQSEALLVDHATSGLDGTTRITHDAGAEEAEADPGTYGEADHEQSSEREND